MEKKTTTPSHRRYNEVQMKRECLIQLNYSSLKKVCPRIILSQKKKAWVNKYTRSNK